jgi:hypothetical protein
MLWTMRSGQVSAAGRMPRDIVDLLMRRLRSQGRERPDPDAGSLPDGQQIILTSAAANPGDSGSPVVDEQGRVIAVTFAGPANPALAKFAYHIHLDEVTRFMAGVPSTPILDLPDAWQLGPAVALEDIDGDGRADVLVAGTDRPEQLLFDLDNDTPAAATKDTAALVRSRKWDFEMALRVAESEPTSSAFYDTNNDGSVDLIHTISDEDAKVNWRFTRAPGGQWKVERNVSITLGAAALSDARLAERFAMLIKRLQARQQR